MTADRAATASGPGGRDASRPAAAASLDHAPSRPSAAPSLDRAAFERLDRSDPLGALREQFLLPHGVIYLDGNSLGPLPRATPARIARLVEEEWGGDLITSWNKHGWIATPHRIGDKIATLIGADAGEVVVAESTSINLFKVLAAALRMRPGRQAIVSEADNFPTDLYMAEGLADLLAQGHSLKLVATDAIGQLLAGDEGSDVAVLMLTHVDFRTGQVHDMRALTKAAQDAGALAIWDLCHSAGAVPVALNDANADFAVGCGYKYLNGGPGAPAFVFVPKRHHIEQGGAAQPLWGWLGHASPFEFAAGYRPAPGIRQYVCSSPSILAMVALEEGVDLFLKADMDAVRAKSVAMTSAFIALVESRCAGFGLTLASPRDAARRGSQVSFAHPDGYAVMQALIARGVVGDFRAPDLMRFGFTPLYLRHVDVWDAVEILRDVLATEQWQEPRFRTRAQVT